RNAIRHELLPLLETKYQPAVRANILRLMDIVAAESEFAESVARSWLSAQRPKAQRKGSLNKSSRPLQSLVNVQAFAFSDLSVAVQRCCLQLQLIDKGIRLDFELIEYLRLNPKTPVDAKLLSTVGTGAPKPKAGAGSQPPCRISRDL